MAPADADREVELRGDDATRLPDLELRRRVAGVARGPTRPEGRAPSRLAKGIEDRCELLLQGAAARIR